MKVLHGFHGNHIDNTPQNCGVIFIFILHIFLE